MHKSPLIKPLPLIEGDCDPRCKGYHLTTRHGVHSAACRHFNILFPAGIHGGPFRIRPALNVKRTGGFCPNLAVSKSEGQLETWCEAAEIPLAAWDNLAELTEDRQRSILRTIQESD